MCSNTGERLTSWMGVQPFLSVSDLLNHWRGTHNLDGCSAVLVSVSDLLKHWRATHLLDGCSAILVSVSDLLKHCKGTGMLDRHLATLVWVRGPDLFTGEQLTFWIYFQCTLLVRFTSIFYNLTNLPFRKHYQVSIIYTKECHIHTASIA